MDGMTMMTNALLKTLGLDAQSLTQIKAEFNLFRENIPVYAGALKQKVESMDARIDAIEKNSKAILAIVVRMESQMDSIESRLLPYVPAGPSLFDDAVAAAQPAAQLALVAPEPHQE